MEDEKYCGYTNKETYLIVFWLNNNEATQAIAESMTKLHVSGIKKDDAFKDWIQNANPLLEAGASLYSDLMTTALSRVNWTEVEKAFEDE